MLLCVIPAPPQKTELAETDWQEYLAQSFPVGLLFGWS